MKTNFFFHFSQLYPFSSTSIGFRPQFIVYNRGIQIFSVVFVSKFTLRAKTNK